MLPSNALAKPVGAIAALTGVLAGAAAIVTALAEPETAACITKVAAALGPHASQVALGAVGVISAGASVVAWFSHAPVPLSAQQQLADDINHGVTR